MLIKSHSPKSFNACNGSRIIILKNEVSHPSKPQSTIYHSNQSPALQTDNLTITQSAKTIPAASNITLTDNHHQLIATRLRSPHWNDFHLLAHMRKIVPELTIPDLRRLKQECGIESKILRSPAFRKEIDSMGGYDLTYAETGNVEAGIVYKTDAASSNKVTITATAPEGSHQPIVYPVAVLSGTKQQKAAEDFLTYLSTPECKAIFEKYGFTMSK